MSEGTVGGNGALAFLPFPEKLQYPNIHLQTRGHREPAERDLQRVKLRLQVVMSVVTIYNTGTGPLSPSSQD